MFFNYKITHGSAVPYGSSIEVNLSGHLKICVLKIPVSNNTTNRINRLYSIIGSEIILTDSGETISSGNGIINVIFEKNSQNWDNFSEWSCGQIPTSLVEGDVIFYDEKSAPLEINDHNYSVLPPVMVLNNGEYFNKFNSIKLVLSKIG